jgi:hypothetical protein
VAAIQRVIIISPSWDEIRKAVPAVRDGKPSLRTGGKPNRSALPTPIRN